ncbi:MAG TPA: AAA family ATPase [Thermoplasmata archaeon]|nr:AAA family ATPase [Thermoplasmata archaeon]
MTGRRRSRRAGRSARTRRAPRTTRPRPPRRLPVALTGTPGVGKSAVAGRLARRWRVVEVAELARRYGAARGTGRSVEVDLARLRKALRSRAARDGVDVIVGHLAHLLPVRAAIVLRCHPRELARRLARARRGSATDRRANFVSEALDLVLAEAAGAGLPVFEVDTTGRSVGAVAREVGLHLRRGGPPRHGVVDWLADRSVTAHLLDAPG